jgi:lipopolysaccharide export system protein LptC
MSPYQPADATDAPVPWRVPLLWRLRETLTAYLPLLMMALLALGTWWLVANTPVPEAERPRAPARHEADYTMNRFVIQRFAADGALRLEIEGDELRHYPDTDTIEIDQVRMRSWSGEGRLTEATARRALTNGAATEVQLLGGAHVVREAVGGGLGPDDEPIEFRGEFLHVFVDTERLRSHLPVTVIHGSGELSGDTFFYDNLSRELRVEGRVHATFLPADAAGTSGVR